SSGYQVQKSTAGKFHGSSLRHSFAPKPTTEDDRCDHSRKLREDEGPYPSGRNSSERVGQRAGNGDGRIGGRSRKREPIGTRDVETDGVRNGLRPPCDAAEDSQ